jgi:hypothetical protein
LFPKLMSCFRHRGIITGTNFSVAAVGSDEGPRSVPPASLAKESDFATAKQSETPYHERQISATGPDSQPMSGLFDNVFPRPFEAAPI